MNVTIYIVF
ncbi:unnamed protein product [Acanthoscelides obtectus]|uniref:Uncharacterized protein n=1 Tax=Acanthoscelides obtectus TaxID=200917 RepID=A0A9P0MLI8_ACAOB|nr:unnamed protein product [Acanthoscelides obtectus]CAK1628306.1 hypothetical protein AOBTE_LOCUS5125 [Acanthoscelides obtectus]